MEKCLMKIDSKNLSIVIIMAITFSSLTLWLIDSWIKYPLFIFEIFTIFSLFLVFNNHNIKINQTSDVLKNLNEGLMIDIFFIISAFYLLILNLLKLEGGIIQLILTLLCTSLLPGYALLNILKLNQFFSKIESLVFSFILSFSFTGIITFVTLPILQETRTIVILSSFIIVGSISAFKQKQNKTFIIQKASFSKNIDIIPIIIVVSFAALTLLFMYPNSAMLPGTDISRHYAWSVTLSRTPDIYFASNYLFFHLNEATFISIANSTMINTQTVLVLLNLMLPLVFYVMAKPYLEKIDARLPSIATVFWILFTNNYGGFAWLNFAKLKLSTISQTQIQLLSTTAQDTYNGTIYGNFGSWYSPASVSLVILMATIYLVHKTNIPKIKYIGLFSTLLVVSYFTHVDAVVLFTLFLALFGMVSKNENYNLSNAIKSSLFGFIIIIIIYYILSLISSRFMITLPLLYLTIGCMIALAFSLLTRKIIHKQLSIFRMKSKINTEFTTKGVILILLIIYIAAFATWVLIGDTFKTSQVDAVGYIPWFIYPLMLGINGFLAIISLYYITKGTTRIYSILTIFIAFLVVAFLIGKIVSIINISFFETGYWEKRFIWYIKISLAILAPISLLLLNIKIRKFRTHSTLKALASTVIIGLVVLSGISTAFLNIEYWHLQANNNALFASSEEMSAINALKEILNNDPKAFLITITETSGNIITFAAPADKLSLKQVFYTADTSEMALALLYRHPAYSHAYIYLHNRDVTQLNKSSGVFLTRYLTEIPLVYSNSQVKIYNATKTSFPQITSDNVLTIDCTEKISKKETNIAYKILSQGFYNYTVACDSNNKIFDAKTVILSFDPVPLNSSSKILDNDLNQAFNAYESISSPSIQKYIDYISSGGRIIVLNTNGYGSFAHSLFSMSSELDVTEIKGTRILLNLPNSVSAPTLTLKDNNIKTISSYATSSSETPFIIQKNYGSGELVYCNIYPIVESLNSKPDNLEFYSILGNLLDDIELKKIDSDAIISHDAYMKNVYLTNNVTIKTSSLLLQEGQKINKVNITGNNITQIFNNVTNLTLDTNLSIIINADNIMTNSGTGFYTLFQTDSSLSIKSSKETFAMRITANGEDFLLNDISVFSTSNEKIKLLAYLPEVSAYNVNFTQFYQQDETLRTRTYGQNLAVSGYTEFLITRSDSYSMIDNVKLGSSLTRDPPLISFNELSTIPTAIFLVLILAPFFIVYFYKKNQSS